MKLAALILGCWLAVDVAARSQSMFPPVSWQDVRKAQPPGLQLKLTLPKDHFYQGEIVNAELEFSNTSATPYHLWIGNYDRSGRIPDIGFKAEDSAGQAVRDPLAWYFLMGGMGGGLGNTEDLTSWKITLPVNQWLSFEKPGLYTVYAWSNRVQKGAKEPSVPRTDGVALVSDKVQLTITPLPPEQEKQIIDAAKGQIALSRGPATTAVEQLRYLGTPASRAELVPLLADQRVSFDAAMGICASPDPAKEASDILAAVSAGKLSLRPDITSIYGRLKTHDLISNFDPAKTNPQQAQQYGQMLMAAMKQADDELTEAGLKSSGGKGDAYISALLTKFQQDNRDPRTRHELAEHQSELTEKQAEDILYGWDYVGGSGDDFLPLAEKMAAAPTFSIPALKVLIKARPNEAFGLLKEDAKQSKSNFFQPRRGSIQIYHLRLQPAPDPALDDTLRARLNSGTDLENTAFYIQEFASPALLPDVTAVYQQHAGKWACEIQKYFLWYVLRCDPKAGAESLSLALASRSSTGCYKRLLGDVLEDRWDESVLPVVVPALDDPDQEVALGAAKVLGLHGNAANIDKALAALARIDAATASATSVPGVFRRGPSAMIAQELLDSKTAHFTPDQQQHLKKIAAGH